MIYLEVYIPVLSLSVDIRAKDTETVQNLTNEICDLIRQKIGEEDDQNEEFQIYHPVQHRVLPKNSSLKECALMTGNRIMLL